MLDAEAFALAVVVDVSVDPGRESFDGGGPSMK
jgi:hypothetical protein